MHKYEYDYTEFAVKWKWTC